MKWDRTEQKRPDPFWGWQVCVAHIREKGPISWKLIKA